MGDYVINQNHFIPLTDWGQCPSPTLFKMAGNGIATWSIMVAMAAIGSINCFVMVCENESFWEENTDEEAPEEYAIYDLVPDERFVPVAAEIRLSYRSLLPLAHRVQIRDSWDAYLFLRTHWDEDTIECQEVFKVVYLNRSNYVIGLYELSKGGLTHTVMDVRLVMGVALKCLASGIILAHNHPSGNKQPSKLDLDLTQAIKQAAKLFEVELIDHLILTRDEHLSLASEDLI